jgi:hypothetical protein
MTNTPTGDVVAAPITEGAALPSSPAPVSTLLDAPADSANADASKEAVAGDPPAADGTEPKADDQPQGAPAEYENFKMPDGISFDPDVETNLKVLAKDLNLSQTQAQQVADLGAKLSQNWTTSLQSHIDATAAAWETAAKADKEIGGDKLAANLGLAKTVLDKFGSPELRELLTQSRLGNNPEVIRMLSKVGSAISDDSRITTGNPSPPKTAARVMFPSQK